MSYQPYKDEIIWIIGASSGIGRALAGELAARGAILALSARRKEALEAIKSSLGPEHKIFVLDVTVAERVIHTAQAICAAFGRIDRVLFLAAAYMPMKITEFDLVVTKQIVDVNLLGAFYTVHAALPILKKQQKGQIALCGSVAGYTGLASGQPYSATKAGVISLAESMKAELPREIDVKLISPGFVRTELTDKNNFSMPMILTPEAAAQAIVKGLLSKRFEIHFPKKFTLMLKLLELLPYPLKFFITHRMK